METFVLYLVSLMGHDRQFVRETAHQIICPLNRSLDLRKHLKKAGKTYGRDAEIVHRLRQINERYRLVYPIGYQTYPRTSSMKPFVPEDLFAPYRNQDDSNHNFDQTNYEVNSRALCKDFVNYLMDKGWTRWDVQKAMTKAINQETITGINP